MSFALLVAVAARLVFTAQTAASTSAARHHSSSAV